MTQKEAEELHEKLAADADVYEGRFLDTELALWGSILTLNGLIVSASSVMVAMMDGTWRLGFLFSIILSLWSAILIFRNFYRRRFLYKCLKLVPSVETCLDDAKFAQYFEAGKKLSHSHVVHEAQNRRDENYAICLLALSTLGCIATVFSQVIFF